jgi:hypothetical protein
MCNVRVITNYNCTLHPSALINETKEVMQSPFLSRSKLPSALSPGRSRYRPEFAEIAKKLCALGATHAELADTFAVGSTTIDCWSMQHPEFRDALSIGNNKAANARVERALYQRAVGYSYETIKVCDGEIVKVRIRKHVPPDVKACVFWLKRRLPQEWDNDRTNSLPGPPEIGPHNAESMLFDRLSGMLDRMEARKNRSRGTHK